MTKLFLAELQTRNFNFKALGQDKTIALNGLKHGLRKHAQEYGIPADWFKDLIDEIELTELESGMVTRDGEKMQLKFSGVKA